MRKFRTLVGVFVRSSSTRGRLAGLILLALLTVGMAIVVRSAPDADADAPGDLIDLLGLTLIVPVASLLVATATLGQLWGDGSLVYVWLRPVSRWTIAAAAWIAAVLVTLPAVVAPLVVAAVVAGGSSDLVVAAALSSGLGVVAYCGVFAMLGIVARHAAIWGIAYILLWEGALAALGGGVNRLALRSYTRSVLERVGDLDLPLSSTSTAVAMAVLLGAALVAVTVATVRLRRMDVE